MMRILLRRLPSKRDMDEDFITSNLPQFRALDGLTRTSIRLATSVIKTGGAKVAPTIHSTGTLGRILTWLTGSEA